MSKLILITGGARSGKSSFALKMASSLKKKVVYIATAAALDPEMKRRIKLHKKERNKEWLTIEEPVEISRAVKKISKDREIVVLDCLTLLISNLMLAGYKDSVIYSEIRSIAKTLKKRFKVSIAITNEVGSGIVPDNEMARRFRDLQGRVNQIISEEANSIYLLVSGIPIKIKGGKQDA